MGLMALVVVFFLMVGFGLRFVNFFSRLEIALEWVSICAWISSVSIPREIEPCSSTLLSLEPRFSLTCRILVSSWSIRAVLSSRSVILVEIVLRSLSHSDACLPPFLLSSSFHLSIFLRYVKPK